jgi:hypothetical protein
MARAESGFDESPAAGWDGSADPLAPGEDDGASRDNSVVREIIEQLQIDPEECWHALEGLTSVEPDVRVSLIDELSRHRNSPGVIALLRLLSTVRDPRTRESARSALAGSDDDVRAPASTGGSDNAVALNVSSKPGCRTRVTHCLVAPVDGQGRGSIVISVNQMAQRRTAAFLCDLERGIRDVFGDVGPESPRASDLLLELDHQKATDCVRDQPELALGLLAGSLLLCGPAVPDAVRDWLAGTLGPEFQPATLPATLPGLDSKSIPHQEIPQRARALLDACPSWLDHSSLTFELAKEIRLREGRMAADPDRDAGAYRFLFEHRLIRRLELYRRMLLWMAWLWKYSGQVELSRSALAVAAQLSDEQYVVPSNPFTMELTTRSFMAAQARL